MRVEYSFQVRAPLARVWEAVIDLERTALCLPGLQLTAMAPDGTCQGTLRVAVGHTSAAYGGTLRVESLDQRGWTAVMQAAATEIGGLGGGAATIRIGLTDAGGATGVGLAVELTITGRLARLGPRMVSDRPLDAFADCLRSRLEQTAA